MSDIIDITRRKGGDKMKLRIREVREKKKLTQEELAKRAGVSRQLVSSLENGSSVNTTTDTLLALAEVLGCHVADFFADSTSR